MNKTLKLNTTNPKIEFKLFYSFSYISIKKIIVHFSKNSDKWFDLLHKSSLQLYIQYKDRQSVSKSFPLLLITLISAQHKNPTFELSGNIIPYENYKNMTSLGNYVTELSIEMRYDKNNIDIDNQIEITLIYKETPGVN